MPRFYVQLRHKSSKNYKNATVSSYASFAHEPVHIGRCKKFILHFSLHIIRINSYGTNQFVDPFYVFQSQLCSSSSTFLKFLHQYLQRKTTLRIISSG